jgi:hypothetical protein
MMQRDGGDYEYFENIVEEIFSAPDRASAMAVIERPAYTGKTGYWNQIVGTRGFKGKNTTNSHSQFNALFDLEQTDIDDNADDSVQLNEAALTQLEQDQT